jgi:hypothetical protein
LLARTLPDPIKFTSHREFVRKVLSEETDLRASGTQFISSDLEGGESLSAQYRKQLNLDGSPSETIAAGYIWTPGTELTERINNVQKQGGSLQ